MLSGIAYYREPALARCWTDDFQRSLLIPKILWFYHFIILGKPFNLILQKTDVMAMTFLYNKLWWLRAQSLEQEVIIVIKLHQNWAMRPYSDCLVWTLPSLKYLLKLYPAQIIFTVWLFDYAYKLRDVLDDQQYWPWNLAIITPEK